MQTFGPVGEPEVDQSSSRSTNATGQPVHFAMRDSADVIKVGGSGANKQITRQTMASNEAGW